MSGFRSVVRITRRLREVGASSVKELLDKHVAMRAALVRLLWDSVADDAACTCEKDDPCPQCDAYRALYGRRWPGAKKAAATMTKKDPPARTNAGRWEIP